MLDLLAVIMGGFMGGMLLKKGGVVLGALIGWLFCEQLRIRKRLAELQQKLAGLPEQPDNRPAGQTRQPLPPSSSSNDNLDDDFIWSQLPQPAAPRPVPPATRPVPAASPLSEALTRFLTGGNLLVKTGVIVLFFGVAFLVKYAAQRGIFPLELRLVSAAVGGCALLATGWYLRNRRAEYALALQGGGIGILYLVTYAAFRLYHLLPDLAAFSLLVLISVLCSLLAVLQESRTLALFGICGGFSAPLTASVGIGNPALLFGYYAVLNAGLIGIAWFRSWRCLNLAGFIATFLISAGWGARYYTPAWFHQVEPFLVLFFLIYLGVSLLFTLRQPAESTNKIDLILVYGTPLAAFALQAALVSSYRYGMAISALIAGLCYLACSRLLWKSYPAARQLAESFLGLGGILLSLSLPLALDGRWTSAAWALEGAALVWSGFRYQRRLVRYSGYLLQLLSGLVFLQAFRLPAATLPLLNSISIGMLFLSISGLVSACLIKDHQQTNTPAVPSLGTLLIGWSLLWWAAAGLRELHQHLQPELLATGALLTASGTALLLNLLAKRLQWRELGLTSLGLLPLMVVSCYAWFPAHPTANGGWYAWPLAFTIGWWLLYRTDRDLSDTFKACLHPLLVWLLALLGSLELIWWAAFMQLDESWQLISRVVMPVCLLGLLLIGNRRLRWPFQQERLIYQGITSLLLAVWSLAWVLFSACSSGDTSPLPWLPLLNPLDLATLAAIALPALWVRRLQTDPLFRELLHDLSPSIATLFALVCFLWINVLLARGLHHWGLIPYTAVALLRSSTAQAAFSILWGVLALVTMLVAIRRSIRVTWFCGAGLLGIVVIKLFVVDLAGQGSVARIISFVAVGLLLLIIGWFAPVPPKSN